MMVKKEKEARVRAVKRAERAKAQPSAKAQDPALLQKKGEQKQFLYSVLLSAVLFLATFFLLQWNVLVSIALSIGLYFGLFNFLKPTTRIGGVDLSSLPQGEEWKAVMTEANIDLQQIFDCSQKAKHDSIREKSGKLHNLGVEILEYIQEDPKKIPLARRFLSYYLDTAANITTKYMEFSKKNVDLEALTPIYQKTDHALDILQQTFEKQFVKLMEHDILDIETDISVLESSIKWED